VCVCVVLIGSYGLSLDFYELIEQEFVLITELCYGIVVHFVSHMAVDEHAVASGTFYFDICLCFSY